ncbi:MAG: hypothetical protein KDC53_21955, partial [Saprospiraceae bacterium]|nr:hypothetical protein [Saprospiraceae bacterium]
MENYRTTLVGILCLLLCSGFIKAQTPSCRDLTIAIEKDDSATIVVGDFVNNADIIPSLRMVLRNSSGGIIKYVNSATSSTTIRFYACNQVGRPLTLHAESNGVELCQSTVRLHEDFIPIIPGRDTTVWCDDTLLSPGVHLDGQPPLAIIPCQGTRPSSYTGDWKDVYPCGNDTAMVIYKMYEAFGKDGTRATGQDTIFVLRLPPITDANLICAMADTIGCDTITPVGPVVDLADRRLHFVEAFRKADGSLDFRPTYLDPSCGISTSVSSVAFDGECPKVYSVRVEIKQNCLGNGEEGYFTCDFWVTEIDTTAPELSILQLGDHWRGDTLIVQASPHNCLGEVSLPPAKAVDDCHAVKLVKVISEEGVSHVLTEGPDHLWGSQQLLQIPFTPDAVSVIYEAVDVCHQVSRDTIWLLVEDGIEPIAAANRMLNVSLNSKKTWLDAAAVNQGSWDNCGLESILVRRQDWTEACIDLCKDFDFAAGDLYLNYLNHLDTLGAVGQHYANTLKWLALDPGKCNDLLLEAWLYDLHRYQREVCEGISETQFDEEIMALLPDISSLDAVRLLGGGWSDAVPFSCEDLCDTIKVELLVMDYWCNWNKTWTNVWVEHKTPVVVAQKVAETIDISCHTFHDTLPHKNYTISQVVENAHQGDSIALAALNSLFGGYQKAWLDNHGAYVDENGQIIDSNIDFLNTLCDCRDTTAVIMVTNGDGQTSLKDSTWRICDYEPEHLNLKAGVLLVNCPDMVVCHQEVWSDLDECGIGSIYRKFTITAGCSGANMVPIELMQQIRVSQRCDLDLGMFQLPENTTIESCGLIFEADGSGNIGGPAHPDHTGRPVFTFDAACYFVGVGYTDKALEVVPQEDDGPCYKIARTWCLLDWCGQPPASDWQNNPEYADQIIKYTQYIKVFCECPCILNCSNLEDTLIGCTDIPMDLTDLFPLFDRPVIESTDTTQICDGTLDSITVIDTNACGIGAIIRTWYLIDPLGQVVDSCSQSISMLPPPISIERTNLYKGDAEPFNCSDSIVMEPVDFDFSTCALFGDVVITNDSPFAVKDSNDASGTYDVGEWIVTYTISSNCFTNIQVVDTVRVIDDVNPTVIAFSDPCVSKAEWLNDFKNDPLNPNIRTMLAVSGSDNCGVDTVLLVSLDSMFFPDQTIRDSILYTYEWQAVDIHENLSDIKTTTILVSDLCTVVSDIRGLILTESQQPISDVQIKVTSDAGTLSDYVAGPDGKYTIDASGLSTGMNIQPYKNSDPRNGISTADIIYMQNYILGLRPFDNIYQKIAADINNDGKVTPLDLIQLRQVLLNSLDAFPQSESWRFINDINGKADYFIQDLSQSMTLNFTGIKIGDIDQSGDPAQSAGRSADVATLKLTDMKLEAGERRRVKMQIPDIQDLAGLQMTLEYDASRLQLTNIEGDQNMDFGEHNFTIMVDRPGVALISWNKTQNTSDNHFLNLYITAREAIRISDAVSISSKYLWAEAYDQELNTIDLA